MAWEKRRGGCYYYRSKRVGNRVIKEYFGCGPEAQQAALEDAQKRAEQEARRLAARQEREQHDAATEAVVQLGSQVDMLVKAALTAAGYHQHRGSWRKHRGQRQEI